MLFIHRKETDPYLNIAAEEYFLKNFREDIFSIWINDPCIVVGKHQNALKEINYWSAREKGFPVIRRISGGGTVYQDKGNLNFSFIITGDKGKLVDYRKYTAPVIGFLKTLGIRSQFEGKSNLVIDGFKISGNSAHVYRDRVIHHGTILFNSDLQTLEHILSTGRCKYEDKSIQSIRKPVTNVSDHLAEAMAIKDFSNAFFEYVLNNYSPGSIYLLTEYDKQEISKLADEKYRKWEWNFGYSPDYSFSNEFEDKGILWKLLLKVSKGIIGEISLLDSKMHHFHEIESKLTGVPHRADKIREILDNVNFVIEHKVSKEVLIRNMF